MSTTASETLARPRAFAVWFKQLERWDVKFFSFQLESQYPTVRLSSLIQEHNEKVNLSDYPDQTFRILGVTNTGGIFHAYDATGKSIHQPYKKVHAGDFAYNPYRVNVGSIGMVPDGLHGNHISPAYIVFAVDRTRIFPKLLELILKSQWFNPTLRAATAGSVRQNLTYDLLSTLEIPLPALPVQQAIVERWQNAEKEIAETRLRVEQLEEEIPFQVYAELGTPKPLPNGPEPKSMGLWWKDVDRWSFNYLTRARQGLLGFTNSNYPILPLSQCLVDTMNGYCIRPVPGPTAHKMLKLNALTPAGLDLSEHKFVKVPNKIAERFSLRKGDLLICRSVGSYNHVAKCALVEHDSPNVLFPDIMIRARFNTTILPEYAREIIQTPLGRSYFQSNARTAVGMWKIGAEDIRNFPIPLPRLDVQQQIVQRVQEKRAVIARERERARQLAAAVEREVEEMIIGVRPVPVGGG